MRDLDWYLEAIRYEVQLLNEKDFIGNIEFKMNIKSGTIANMNIGLGKSVKKPEPSLK